MLFLTFFLLLSACYCKSIQNQPITSGESLDDKIGNLETLVRNLENRINILNETDHKSLFHVEPVLFYAIMYNRHFILGTESTVVFETIIINIGNHYNKYDWVFVAPRKGVYLFSWTISIYAGNNAVTELMVENNVISSTGDTTTTNTGQRSTSMTALCKMEKGDHAFIKTTGYGSTNNMYSNDNYPRSSFLGMIVRNE